VGSSKIDLLEIISFTIGISLVMISTILILKQKILKKYNSYFISIMLLAGVQRILFGLYSTGHVVKYYVPLNGNLYYGTIIVPIFYLFFKNSAVKKTSIREDVIHFILALLFIMFCKAVNDEYYNRIFFLIYSTIYIIILFLLFLNQNKNEKKLIKRSENINNKIWQINIVILIIFVYIIANYLSLTEKGDVLVRFYSLSSLIWLIFLIFLYNNPIILYGKEIINYNNNLFNENSYNLWKDKINIPDKRELQKLDISQVLEIISKINSVEKKYVNDLKIIPTTKNLSDIIGKPQVQIDSIFKYYCLYSKNDYLNVLKIQASLRLIDENYLNNHTIESLAVKTQFGSRITFFNNFKKHVGMNVTEYIRTIKS
jgi:AraC-like DNA-binding protein